MSIQITKHYLTYNDCYKTVQTIKPKGIMVHSTGSNNPKLSRYVQPDDGILGKNTNNNDWNRGGISKCVHAFIGKDKNGVVRCYQTLPWNHRGWHGGGSSNNTHIGFEICEDGLNEPVYFAKVYEMTVELCVHLCKLYGLTEKTIICHSEGYKLGIASNHGDVMHWFPRHGKSMDTLRTDVKKKLNGEISGATPPPPQEKLMWGKTEFKKGQIGKVTILKPINLWADKNGKLEMVRILKLNEEYRVYGYRADFGGQYDLGAGHWVTNIPSHIRYETPSKALLAKAKELYG